MVDWSLGDEDQSPLELSFLNLEDDSPSSSSDPVKDWLLGLDQSLPRPFASPCPDPFPIQSGEIHFPLPQESCDLGYETLSQAVLPITSDCRGEIVEKGADLTAEMKPLGDVGCQMESEFADLLTTGCQREGAREGSDLTIKVEPFGEGGRKQDSAAADVSRIDDEGERVEKCADFIGKMEYFGEIGCHKQSEVADVDPTGCEGEGASKVADLTVELGPLDEGGCKQESGVVNVSRIGCEGERVGKGGDWTVKEGSLGELKISEGVVDMESESESDEESESESDVESESESDEESESELDMESESSSCSEEEEDDGIAVKEDGVSCRRDGVDVEDGEIRASEMDELVLSSDEEDLGTAKGPIRSKNEAVDLPQVPPVSVVLSSRHETLPVGVISSIIGSQVIVDGSVKHNPLNEGSILWITETRCPLGLIDEIFGPVKNPYYVVRYNSVNEIPVGIHEGAVVSFVAEFSNVILNQNDLHKKGYDASGENDEEVSEEADFSDDEKEIEYKRSLKPPKRGMANQVKFEKDSNSKKNNRFKGSRPPNHIHTRHKPHLLPPKVGTDKAASFRSTENQLPSTFGINVAKDTSNSLLQPCGNTPTVPPIPQSVQAAGFLGVQPQALLQQQPGTMWVPQATTQQQNLGLPVTIQQQNPRLPGVFGVNAPFQYQQQPQQSQTQLQQQLFPDLATGLINGFPFQQHISSCQALSPFNLTSMNGQLNSNNGQMPRGLPNFCQPPFASNNGIADPGMPVINSVQLFRQLASAAINQANFNQESNSVMQHEPHLPPPDGGTDQTATCLSIQGQLPSISGSDVAKDTSNRLLQPRGNIPSTVQSIHQSVQESGFFGVQPQTHLQQQPGAVWASQVITQRENIGTPVTIHQQNAGLPGRFGAKASFQCQQQPQQTQPQLQQQQQTQPQFSAALPGNVHPPMRFNMGSSSNHRGSRPSNARQPFLKRGHP